MLRIIATIANTPGSVGETAMEAPTERDVKKLSDSAKKLFAPRQAVLLYYTVKTGKKEKDGFPAFVLQYPKNDIRVPIQFGVVAPGEKEAVVVPVQKGGIKRRGT